MESVESESDDALRSRLEHYEESQKLPKQLAMGTLSAESKHGSLRTLLLTNPPDSRSVLVDTKVCTIDSYALSADNKKLVAIVKNSFNDFDKAYLEALSLGESDGTVKQLKSSYIYLGDFSSSKIAIASIGCWYAAYFQEDRFKNQKRELLIYTNPDKPANQQLKLSSPLLAMDFNKQSTKLGLLDGNNNFRTISVTEDKETKKTTEHLD